MSYLGNNFDALTFISHVPAVCTLPGEFNSLPIRSSFLNPPISRSRPNSASPHPPSILALKSRINALASSTSYPSLQSSFAKRNALFSSPLVNSHLASHSLALDVSLLGPIMPPPPSSSSPPSTGASSCARHSSIQLAASSSQPMRSYRSAILSSVSGSKPPSTLSVDVNEAPISPLPEQVSARFVARTAGPSFPMRSRHVPMASQTVARCGLSAEARWKYHSA